MSSRSRSRDRSRSRSRDRSRSRSRSPGKSPSPKRGERSWSRSRSRSPRRVTGGAEPRSIYVAGFSPRVPASEVETLFRRFGDVQRVDMKKGFAFVFMYNDDDSRDAIKDLNNSKFDGARLRVEFAKGSGATKRREVERAEAVKSAPTRTLFMVNFDEYRTRESDIKVHACGQAGIVGLCIVTWHVEATRGAMANGFWTHVSPAHARDLTGN